MKAFKLDMIEGDFLAVGADQVEQTRGDFDTDDDLGHHRYCQGCTEFWACHRMMRCGLEIESRRQF